MHSGRQQLAIAALAVASFAAGYGVTFWFDSRQPEDAYANYMSQCVFLGDSEDQCAEEWRSMDAQERFFYSEGGRRAQARFERKRREEEKRAKAECEAQ